MAKKESNEIGEENDFFDSSQSLFGDSGLISLFRPLSFDLQTFDAFFKHFTDFFQLGQKFLLWYFSRLVALVCLEEQQSMHFEQNLPTPLQRQVRFERVLNKKKFSSAAFRFSKQI